MAISGTYTYNDFRDEVIKDALGLIGVTAAEETPEASDLQTAARFLNRLLKFLSTKGLHIWRREQGFLIPQYNQFKYDVGSPSTDYAVSDYVTTNLSADEASSSTVMNVDDTTGFVNGDVILIQLNDGTLFQTTISSHTSTTITIASGLTSAAAEGNVIYSYDVDNLLVRPLKILDMRYRITQEQLIDIPMTELAYEEYFQMPYKNDGSSYPTQWMYQPNRESLGNIYLWPAPQAVNVVFPFTYEITLADITSANQTLDVPQEWLLAIVYQLAVTLAPMWGKDARLQTLAPMASYYLEEALNWDSETVSVSIEPNSWQTNTNF